MVAEELSDEFIRMLKHGRQTMEAKKGFAAMAGLIAMFYEGLRGVGLPEPLVYILTCNFAAQAMETFFLEFTVQAQVGGKESDSDDRG